MGIAWCMSPLISLNLVEWRRAQRKRENYKRILARSGIQPKISAYGPDASSFALLIRYKGIQLKLLISDPQ